MVSVKIHKDVSEIELCTFNDCSSLVSIKVDPGNPYFSSYNGVLYNKEKTRLICFPKGKDVGVNISTKVEIIDPYAFSMCTNLRDIKLPKSVRVIGDYAFECCKSLSSITIPKSVEKIGAHAFIYCMSIKTIEIPNSVIEIGDGAFSSCCQLTSITVDSNNSYCCSCDDVLYDKSKTKIISCAASKEGTFTIPNTVKEIGANAFDTCNKLTSIEIPDSVTKIGEYAFFECKGLSSLKISDSVSRIGKAAFQRCESLTSVNIPSSLTKIEERVFAQCSGLEQIKFPESLLEIGDASFWECRKIVSVQLPNNLIKIGDYAFDVCENLSTVKIPESVTEIGVGAFHYNKFDSINIPSSVLKIGDRAFFECQNLTDISVAPENPNYSSKDGILFNKEMTKILRFPAGNYYCDIPDTVTELAASAFFNCPYLIEMHIPNSVTKIVESCETVKTDIKGGWLHLKRIYCNFLDFPECDMSWLENDNYDFTDCLLFVPMAASYTHNPLCYRFKKVIEDVDQSLL